MWKMWKSASTPRGPRRSFPHRIVEKMWKMWKTSLLSRIFQKSFPHSTKKLWKMWKTRSNKPKMEISDNCVFRNFLRSFPFSANLRFSQLFGAFCGDGPFGAEACAGLAEGACTKRKQGADFDFKRFLVAGSDICLDLLDRFRERGALFHFRFNLFDGVDDRAVIPSAEVVSDFVL